MNTRKKLLLSLVLCSSALLQQSSTLAMKAEAKWGTISPMFTRGKMSALDSVLMAVAKGEKQADLQSLLNQKADPAAQDLHGYTPLMYAIISHPQPLTVLPQLIKATNDLHHHENKESGATHPLDIQNDAGGTASDLATALPEKIAIWDLLINAKASLDVPAYSTIREIRSRNAALKAQQAQKNASHEEKHEKTEDRLPVEKESLMPKQAQLEDEPKAPTLFLWSGKLTSADYLDANRIFEKLTQYCLKPDHKDQRTGNAGAGQNKSKMFAKYNFTLENAEALQQQILRNAVNTDVILEACTPSGRKYGIFMMIEDPKTKTSFQLTTGWILNPNDGKLYMTTAFPKEPNRLIQKILKATPQLPATTQEKSESSSEAATPSEEFFDKKESN